MKVRKPFHGMSIRKQMKFIVVLVLALFILLCELISISTQQLLFRNEDEHMQVTALRLRDQLELVYEKMSNFCINIGGDEAIQTFMRSDYSEISITLEGATECLTRHKSLEPMIEDISLVNDTIHYSNVYRNEELDEIRSQVYGIPFKWIGMRSHGFSMNSYKPDMMVYAGDITVGSENIGTIVISVDASAVYEEKESEVSQIHYLADEEGILIPFSQSAEAMQKAWQIWIDRGQQEALERGGYYTRNYYFDKMGFWLVSVLNLENIGTGADLELCAAGGCILLCIFLLITRGIEVFYFVSEDVLQLKVMEMLLQPIVENSVFHGLEPENGKGGLYIGARTEGGMLVITVKDDGVGIGPERLEGEVFIKDVEYSHQEGEQAMFHVFSQ